MGRPHARYHQPRYHLIQVRERGPAAGKPIYFRTLTTDDHRGPGMARFLAKRVDAKTVYVIDDSGAYGVGLADAFVAGARLAGMTIMG